MALTLITGTENQVWHRDSIDCMHEWLHRELGSGARKIRKRVFEDYGHVDLWWSRRAEGPAAELTGQLVCYARSVAGVQWERMEDGTLGEQLNPWGAEMFRTLRTVEPQTAPSSPPTTSGSTRRPSASRPATTGSTAPSG